MATSSDALALATLNAAVVTIYEAVLIALVARAGSARDTLLGRFRKVRRQLSEQPLQAAALLLEGHQWSEYSAQMPEQAEDLLLRLEELLYPDRVEERVKAATKRAEHRVKAREITQRYHELYVEIADLVERDGEEAVKERLIDTGWDTEQADHFLKQAKGRSSPASGAMLPRDGGPVGRPPCSQYRLYKLSEAGDRGVVLLEVLAALACQPPMPARLRDDHGRVAESDSKMPVLTTAHQAETWVSQVLDRLGDITALVADRKAEISSLMEAAKEHGYLRRDDWEKIPQSVRDSEVQQELVRLRGESVYAVKALEDTYVYVIGLRLRLDEWRATRPSLWYRWSLALGLAVGAGVFVVGVALPILATHAPGWLTVDVPAYAFAMVAFSLVVVAFSYVLKL